MTKFYNWLVTSSTDPLAFSMTVRGALVLAGGWALHASILACGLGLYCFGLTDQIVNQAVDVLTNFAYGVALIAGAMMGAYGLARKWKNGRWSAL